MYPIIIIDGVAHKVSKVEYDDNGKIEGVSYFDNGKYKHVVDIQNPINLTGSAVMDLSKVLIWNDRYQPIYETLENVIDNECRHLHELAIMYTESDNQYHKEKYKQLQQKVFGLIDAQELVNEFMVEDVDLSGGEDIV